MNSASVISELSRQRVVPVIRTADAMQAGNAIEWLVQAGFKSFEITLTIPGAVDLIKQFAGTKKYLIGAGTVLNSKDAEKCIAAGAQFIVAPCMLPEVAQICQQRKITSIIGALTPTEAYQAMLAGADAIKIFPVSSVGGVEHIKALKVIYPNTVFVPTGGIPLDGVMPYIHAGAAFVGLGGKLVDQKLIADGQRNKIIEYGRAVLASVKG